MTATAPTPDPPPEKPPRWDLRLREQPFIVFILVTVGAAIALNGLKTFATDTLPWLVSFLAPVADFLGQVPPSAWISVLLGTLASTLVANFRREARRRKDLRLTSELWTAWRIQKVSRPADLSDEQLRNLGPDYPVKRAAFEKEFAEQLSQVGSVRMRISHGVDVEPEELRAAVSVAKTLVETAYTRGVLSDYAIDLRREELN